MGGWSVVVGIIVFECLSRALFVLFSWVHNYKYTFTITPIGEDVLPVVIFGPLATKPLEFLRVWGLGDLFPSGYLPATNGG